MSTATAVCVGVGSGLFVDEVGKFITARNDYFTPLAAPIIYAVFLGVFGLALLARRARPDGPRVLAYTVAARCRDLADGPLRPAARATLLRDLETLASNTTRPDLVDLAAALRPLVEAAPVAEPPHRTRPAADRPRWSSPRPARRSSGCSCSSRRARCWSVATTSGSGSAASG